MSIWAASWRNQQNGMCAQRRLRSAWAFAQSDQNLRCPHEPLTTHWARSEDSDQIGWMSRLIWVFARRTCHFVGFVMRRLIYHLFYSFTVPAYYHKRKWHFPLAMQNIILRNSMLTLVCHLTYYSYKTQLHFRPSRPMNLRIQENRPRDRHKSDCLEDRFCSSWCYCMV